jgi:hypothetical protein
MFTLLLSARHFIGFASYLMNTDYIVLLCCGGEWKEIEFKEYNRKIHLQKNSYLGKHKQKHRVCFTYL